MTTIPSNKAKQNACVLIFSSLQSISKTFHRWRSLYIQIKMFIQSKYNASWSYTTKLRTIQRLDVTKCVGIDYGRIGSQVSVLAELLGMKVVLYDPVQCLPLGNELNRTAWGKFYQFRTL